VFFIRIDYILTKFTLAVKRAHYIVTLVEVDVRPDGSEFEAHLSGYLGLGLGFG
jgi:hypothetical protein